MVAVARRSVLAAGLSVGASGVLLAGCTAGDGSAGPSPSPTAPPPPDPLLAELADENTLLVAYDATIARYPALGARLAGPRADHAAHAAALAQLLGGPAAAPTASPAAAPTVSPTGPPTGTPGGTPTGTPNGTAGGTPAGAAGGTPTGAAGGTPTGRSVPGGVGVAGTPVAALAALRAAERAAASARGTAALTAAAGRARLLAGISASEASHLVVLA